MTNLTEKWKKGEQPEGWYYIKCEDGEYIDYYEAKIGWLNYNGIKKVVGRVPSYELWKAVHEQWEVLLEENTKLKAVLKRCREFVDDFSTNNDEVWAYKNAVLNGIDELLGEE